MQTRVQKADMELGYLRLKVEEVARNKVMNDTWPLHSAVKGDIQLTLSFQPIIFEDAGEVRRHHCSVTSYAFMFVKECYIFCERVQEGKLSCAFSVRLGLQISRQLEIHFARIWYQWM